MYVKDNLNSKVYDIKVGTFNCNLNPITSINFPNFYKVMELTMNLCKLSTGRVSNLFFGPVFKLLLQYSNYSFKCPAKKGFFIYKNMKTDKLVFPVKKAYFKCRITFLGIPLKSKRKEIVTFVELIGVYQN